METINLQPQTLISLTALIKDWNQDPLAFSNSLLITRNQVLVTDGNTILLSLQFPTEDPDYSQNDFLNDYTEPITELPNEELTLLPEVNEPDNIEEHEPNLVPVSGLTRIKEDLMSTETVSVVRANPLLTFTWKDQANEIIS